MTRLEMIRAVAKRSGMTHGAVVAVLNAHVEEVTAQLQAGNVVRMYGIGSLRIAKQPARVGRVVNGPRKGEVVPVAAYNKVKFRRTESLFVAVNPE